MLNDPACRGYAATPEGLGAVAVGTNAPLQKQIAAEREMLARGMAFVRTHVSNIPRLVFHKYLRFLGIRRGRPLWKDLAVYCLDLPLTPLSLPGIILFRRREAMLGAVLPTVFMVAVFFGDHRYRMPIIPLMAALSGVSIGAACGWLRSRRQAGGATAGATL